MELLQEQAAGEETAAAEWNQAYATRLLTWASERVRGMVTEPTWQAFWQTANEGKSGEEVANNLGMSVAAVYLAKSRVMARLRKLVAEIEGEPDQGK
jgi:RNA polymerase sigma-70 factor (ECF subfamily)